MKYIVFESIYTKWRLPVMFPDNIVHSEVLLEGFKPVSAGFVDLNNFEAFGSSSSLKFGCNNPLDTNLLRATLLNDSTSLKYLNMK